MSGVAARGTGHPERVPRLRMAGIRKHFGGVQALRDVSLDLYAGEVVALVGDNGAGKSTLVKVMAGVHQPSSGQMWLDGRPVTFGSPAEARSAGIETVHQDLGLVGTLDVAANFFLGREIRRGGVLRPFHLLDKRAMRRKAQEGITSLRVQIPKITNEVRKMSGGQRQGVAIARAAFWQSNILLLDEPTAALGVKESGEVMNLIRRLRDENGLSIVMISHNMEHVWSLSDRIAVLRQGRMIAQIRKSDTTPAGVVELITGAHLAGLTAPSENG